jgi:hypothetical protein
VAALRLDLEFGNVRAKMMAAGFTGDDLPPAVHIPAELSWVWRAWHRLHQDRPWLGGGFGPPVPGRIPWVTIVSWGRFNRYGTQDIKFLDRCFTKMDETFMRHWNLKNPAAPDKASRHRGNQG